MAIFINAELCTGCRLCELICSFTKQGECNPKRSRIKVTKKERFFVDIPVVCRQCADPSCVASCPVDALRKEADGTVRVDDEACIGCQACTEACAFGAISLNPANGRAAVCDLCDGDPQCIKWCPTGALASTEHLQEGNKGKVPEITRSLLAKWGIAWDEYEKYYQAPAVLKSPGKQGGVATNTHYGWAGTILRVDLTKGKIEKQPFPEEWKVKFLGGRNLNSKILFDEVPPHADPMGPENRLIIGTGLMTGLLGPSTGRLTITAKSPLTGIHGDANAGGDFAAELKYAGYDHIIISGRSERPVYLFIDDDQVELRDASHLWGKTVFEADRIIKMEDIHDQDVKTLMIGPAGENLVRFACVITNLYRAAGRCGMGAVMGSKNLKAVAVRGSGSLKIAMPKEYVAYLEQLFKEIYQAPNYPTYSRQGTPSMVRIKHQRGEMGIRNKQENEWVADKVEAIAADTFLNTLVVKSKACFSCPIHCAHGYVVKEGPYQGTYGEGMEWAVIGPFGNELDNPRLDAISKCHELISQYGLDSISTGLMIAFAMELFQRGILTTADTGGLDLTWGNHELIVDLVHKIAHREGIGNLLADGKRNMMQKLGGRADEAARCSQHVKWLDEPSDPRGDVARTLNYAVATRGADHLRGRPSYATWVDDGFERFLKKRYPGRELEIPKTFDFQSYDPVLADLIIFMENICSAADALEICKFTTTWLAGSIGLSAMAKLASLATGLDFTAEKLMDIVDRGWQIERSFSVREGISAQDDLPSDRFFEPIRSGPHKGKQLDRNLFTELLQTYYQKRGWDINGIPDRENLEKLDLKDVADKLGL